MIGNKTRISDAVGSVAEREHNGGRTKTFCLQYRWLSNEFHQRRPLECASQETRYGVEFWAGFSERRAISGLVYAQTTFSLIHYYILRKFECDFVLLADQTPTPTRLIRNCEEVGLFEDLQHVNPFEETFRRAVESKDSSTNPSQNTLDPLSMGGDDTLHTPHVMPLFNISNSGKANAMAGTGEGSKDTSPLCLDAPSDNEKDKDDDLPPQRENTIKIEVDELADAAENDDSTAKSTPKSYTHSVSQETSTANRASVIFVPQVSNVVQPVSGVIYEISPRKFQPILPLPQPKVPQVIMLNTAPASSVRTDGQPANALKKIFPKSDKSTTVTNTRSLVKEKLKEALLKIKGNTELVSGRDSRPQSQIEDKTSIKSLATVSSKDLSLEKLPVKSSTHTNPSAAATDKTKSASQTEKNYEKNRAAAAAKRYRAKFKNEHNNLKRKNTQLEAENERLQTELRALKTILLAHQDCSVSKAMRMGE